MYFDDSSLERLAQLLDEAEQALQDPTRINEEFFDSFKSATEYPRGVGALGAGAVVGAAGGLGLLLSLRNFFTSNSSKAQAKRLQKRRLELYEKSSQIYKELSRTLSSESNPTRYQYLSSLQTFLGDSVAQLNKDIHEYNRLLE